MNKKFKIVIIALILTLPLSCSKGVKDASVVATDFLTAYFQTDYSKAASMCTDTLSNELSEALKDFETLEDGVKKELKAAAEKVSINIISATPDENNKKIIKVEYDIIMPDTPPIRSSLTLNRVDKIWKIADLH